MLKKFVTVLGGDSNKQAFDRSTSIGDKIISLEPGFEALSSEAQLAKTAEFFRIK